MGSRRRGIRVAGHELLEPLLVPQRQVDRLPEAAFVGEERVVGGEHDLVGAAGVDVVDISPGMCFGAKADVM